MMKEKKKRENKKDKTKQQRKTKQQNKKKKQNNKTKKKKNNYYQCTSCLQNKLSVGSSLNNTCTQPESALTHRSSSVKFLFTVINVPAHFYICEL